MEYKPRLQEKYNKEILPALMKKFEFKNVMQAPKVVKITINQGVGEGITDKKMVDNAAKELTQITGQHAVITKSKKDISNFKVRKGMPIGVRVTMRREKMYEFLDRLISVAMPRIKDFQGINDKGFDGRGNYTVGIEEQIIFPEISLEAVQKLKGMSITFVTSAQNDEEAYELLKLFGLPFKNMNA
ncbi:MAG: 50S ribosomal protein L5 [Bacteroidales bacterium]|nr:50S ribosomal protein L5 [Bacteroidales bacterium]